MSTEQLQQRWSSALMNNYGTPKVALVRGSGAVVYDAEGNRYVDFLGGIAVNSLGHAHPAIVEAVTQQLGTLGHVSNLYVSEPVLELAEKLLAHFGDGHGRAFFCNSGTEANEAAFKIARLTGRHKIVACDEAFHGRTMGALALTGQPSKRAPFEPMPPGVVHVPYGDAAALAAAVDSDTAAVFLEPIMGESGVVVPPLDYLAEARRITSEHGALLILDEVQTGICRTGPFFAHQAVGIVPDVITLAKGLGGGLPIGAVLAQGRAAELLTPGLHGTTFGGNPVSAAAALAVLRTIDEQGLAAHVESVGKTLIDGIEELGHPLVDHVRGAGLLIGIQLTEDVSAKVEAAARAAGYLINPPKPNVIRLAPPLILTEAQAQGFLADLPGILDAASQESE
ncbi:acetylornithine aminotransferase [Nocardia sp. 852002-20019_SCH5090214]|uniref:acetylornithine transaminase n=1 Tax=Nocardia TaxID=1817 RepID=UPI0007A4AB97|nr:MULTISPECIES: acetylornithine transaminase [Nocardia]OBF83299.1 acetylornithine aminotransferase [Mycobacterium sp. 852002-51759_SCH5129042]MBF6277121.1 acetylornithine transaminase [Nocardia nova]OBA54161.1 acetylornithine aminotransferase [Nocardia sp. 852002-51101_SCH5132738]OBA68408.1 acetylornithine aminotransferase [Nocardia sp. 852002-20019_SCH5090214]OBB38770.1 acetylornithine aminotransferase [Nocardia sp. 852002-51244_SCH5132740]